MIFFASLMKATAWVLDNVLSFMMIIVIGNVIVSWVNADRYNPLVRFINSMCEPMNRAVKRFIPTVFGGIDLTPMIILLLIGFLRIILVENLSKYAVVISGY